MSGEPDAELEDSTWERPVVLPAFHLPSRLATAVGWALVASAALTIISALVTAVSYHEPGLAGGVVPRGLAIQIHLPSIAFADRVSLFTTRASALTVALVVLVAVVVVAMAPQHDETRTAVARNRSLLVVTSVVGCVVILASVAKAIVVLSNASQFDSGLPGNKASDVLGLVPAALIAAAAVGYALSRFRHVPEAERDAEGHQLPADA